MTIDLETCKCNPKQPSFICFFCWQKGIRPEDRHQPNVQSFPEVVHVEPIPDKLLRDKAAGILECTCDQRRDGTNGRKDCPRHKEFYGTSGRADRGTAIDKTKKDQG